MHDVEVLTSDFGARINPAMNFKPYPIILPLFIFVFVVANGFQRAEMPAAKAKEAKRVFKQKCSKCHGQDGAGNNYGQIIGVTNLTDPAWQQKVDDKRALNSITHGRGQMPAFGEKLTEAQIKSLVLYVRTLGK
jgi:cbb3-type cytochrome c oxidase subunit III